MPCRWIWHWVGRVASRPHHRAFGPESSGKTTIALHAVAQSPSGTAVSRRSFDAEHAARPQPGASGSGSTSRRLPGQPARRCGRGPSDRRECWCYPMRLTSSSSTRWRRLVPRARDRRGDWRHVRGSAGPAHEPGPAQLTGGVSRSKCVLIFINQIREKIGVMFSSPETTPGGRGPQVLQLLPDRRPPHAPRPSGIGEEVVGSRIKAKVVKNKVAPTPVPSLREFDMMYTHGISREGGPPSTWRSSTSSSKSPTPGSITAISVWDAERPGERQAAPARQQRPGS